MAFDEVIDHVLCPHCRGQFETTAQIKYGYCRGHRLLPGDALLWCDPPGRRAPLLDQGSNSGGVVLVPAATEELCPLCRTTLPGARVLLRDNVIEKVLFDQAPGDDAIQLSPPQAWFNLFTRRVAGSGNEDRLQVFCRGNLWTIAVADGAGGTAGGAIAASTAVNSAASFGELPRGCDEWVAFACEIDHQLVQDRGAGKTTLIILQVINGFVQGASVGDSQAWIVTADDILDLTANQHVKPLLGSGLARPSPISPHPITGRLLVGTDGLFKYVPTERLVHLAAVSPLDAAVDALVDAARLPTGGLHDDIAIILGAWGG